MGMDLLRQVTFSVRPRAAKVYQISIVVLLSLFRVSVVMNGLEHSGVELNDDNPNKTDAFSYPSVLLLLIMGLRLKVAVFHGEDHVSGISSLCAAQGCIVPSCAHTHTYTNIYRYIQHHKSDYSPYHFFRFFMYEHKKTRKKPSWNTWNVDYDRIGPLQ